MESTAILLCDKLSLHLANYYYNIPYFFSSIFLYDMCVRLEDVIFLYQHHMHFLFN